MKKILITGKNSYIGTSLEKWLAKEPEKYQVDTVSTRDGIWEEKDFSPYDVVFHVAGIAHVSADPKMKDLYYRVNRDLTIAVASKAKNEGVKQFIFMSSIIIYGESSSGKRVITPKTAPTPSDFYGDSKLQAEVGIRQLQATDFNVVIVRPPMIYGKESKGNYRKLARLAKVVPFFPDVENERSMLHIDNLCEFLKKMIDFVERGIFFPQNKEYVKTSEMVRLIGKAHGNRIILTRIFNRVIEVIFKFGVIHKIFGNLVYEKNMSVYKENYQIVPFEETIHLTEVG